MFWQEVFLERLIKKHNLLSTLSYLFSISEKEILICSNIANCEVKKDIKVVCETSFVEAEFPLKICIFIKDDKIIPQNDILFVGDMAKNLQCKIVISDDSIDPYSMILIDSEQNYRNIRLDIEIYDNCKEYEIEE